MSGDAKTTGLTISTTPIGGVVVCADILGTGTGATCRCLGNGSAYGDCFFGTPTSATKIQAGFGTFAIALQANKFLWGWGDQTDGSGIGDLSITNRSTAVATVGCHSFTDIAAGAGGAWSICLKSDGSAWGMGSNSNGQIGDSSVANRSSPVSVVGAHSFSKIAANSGNSMGVKAGDGSCWCWGGSANGNNGDSQVAANRSSPVSVLGGHSFDAIQAGQIMIGLKNNNGTVWGWGVGPVGDNTANNRSSPVSVLGAHSFTQIATGGSNTAYGLKAAGSIWAWGTNSNGRLGDSSTTNRSSPVSVVGAHTFTQLAQGGAINSMYALKSDGSCWAWGLNTNGECGDNSLTARSSPVSVVGGHSFTAVCGGQANAYGLKSDGTIWAWGTAASGALGDNQTTVNRSSPTSVAVNAVTGRTWAAITAGDTLYWNQGLGAGPLTTSSRINMIHI